MKSKGFKITALILTLAITIIAHPFLVVSAQSTQHGHQTFTGGRLEWEINTYDFVQDVTIDGTTFRAGGLIILDYYLTNTSTGTLRAYWTGFNSGWYTAMNIYAYGATISSVSYSGTAGITFKINNPSDRVTIVISFNGTDMNTSLQSITSFSTVASLTTASSSSSTVQDIDVKLSGISSTLQQIITLLGSGNVSVLDYLDEISEYSAYLEDLQISLDNIDNQIDTISWINIDTSYRGYTTDFINYDTTIGEKAAGYYVYDSFYANPANPGLYRIEIPIGNASINFENLQFYTMYNNSIENHEITFDQYLFYKNRSSIVLYFIVNENYHSWPNGNNPLVLQVKQRVFFYSTTSYKMQYILQDDIEYWTIYQAIQNKTLLENIKNLSVGSTDNSTVNNIDNITGDLDDQIQESTQSQQQIDNLLHDFNLNFDLDDYRFDFGSDYVQYFKIRLTDLYDINDLKPFYIIPLVLFIVWRLLSG